MRPPVNVRPAESLEDWEFIRKAWFATYMDSPAVRGADREHYGAEMTRLFAAIMPAAQARMGCDPEDDDNRLAFAVFSGDELRFVYVMQDFRRMGIVPVLLDGLGIKRYTFNTIQGSRRLSPHDRGWKFCPRFTLP